MPAPLQTALAVLVASCLACAGCTRGSSGEQGAAETLKPAFVVTFSERKCELAVFDSVFSRREMPCADVASYLTDTAKLEPGARFDLVTAPNVDESEYDQVLSRLARAGYELTPGIHVRLLTQGE